MKNKKGFTLVEMLVVIGIIVVLTGVMSVTVVQNIERSNNTKAAVELHYSDGYNEAKAQVVALRNIPYGDPDGFSPMPTPDDGGGTTTPTPTPTATPTPTTKPPTPTATPTPTPVPLPTPAAGTSVSDPPTDTSGWGTPYNWKFVLGYPQDSKAQYLTLYIPTGATLYIPSGETRGVIVSQSGNEAVIKVNAWQTGLELGVSYPSGGPELVITVVSRKAP